MHLTQKISTILIFISTANIVVAQKTWDLKTLEKANTAKNISYLTTQEKKVIQYCNLVRLNPKLFLETFVKEYLDSTKENNNYTGSLIKTLRFAKSTGLLYPSEKLYALAKEHAIDFGKKGKTGHADFDKRFMKFTKECDCAIGENCDYGSNNALDIVMSLLIDADVPDLGHRENILDPEYKNIGVSIQEHKKYDWTCVMDFSGATLK
ncbi:MAG: hypothetical protein A3F72_07780 [Bacteroidetes bacterium RIFCSPLOWO2_12_FULL_35_15]|nr:MAG: hypothetical protein A3F72_07780 [Bacteroidetes bacterium RIFCSPLOWO2_12_FULL_35_15]